MHVLATAGHVDHGKSTLVRALTGMEPDRLEEERRRGLTIELGFVWTTIAAGEEPTAFVDVPGHQRFLSTMLAGVGPVPAAMLVVAADGGWEAQTAEHVAALDALGVRHGLVAITRSDLADPAPVRTEVLSRLASTSFGAGSSGGGAPEVVAVSARTGAGLDELRGALTRLTASLPAPERSGRVRVWVDRAFTIGGAGTVVTGTLGEGTLTVDDELELATASGPRTVRVRGLQSLGRSESSVAAVARVAVNLRGLPASDVARGDVLLTPGADSLTAVIDVRVERPAAPLHDLASDLVLHVGAASVVAHLRPFDEHYARLTLERALPLRRGDRALLRDPGRQALVGAVVVQDIDPPALDRRGAARSRAAQLTSGLDVVSEVSRRGAIVPAELTRLGFDAARLPDELREVRGLIVTERDWAQWSHSLRESVESHGAAEELSAGLTPAEAAQRAGIPRRELVEPLAKAAGLHLSGGRVTANAPLPAVAQQALAPIIQRLQVNPFDAPEAGDLAAAGVTPQILAAAERRGLLLRLAGNTGPVVLAPDVADRAVQRLATLAAPFTVSDARGALGVSRRIAVPLLEHLDATGRTRRVDATGRVVRA